MSAAKNGKSSIGWRRAIVVTVAAALVGALTFALTGPSLGAQTVANPGPFNLKLTGGEIDINGTNFDLTPNAVPACQDTEDNDEDGATDYPADAQCAGLDDNNELAGGHQPKQDITINGTVTSTGSVSIPQSGIFFPPSYIEQEGAVLTVNITPTAAGTGQINPLTGVASMNIKVRVQLQGSPSGVSLGSSCFIGSAGSPIDLTVITGTTSPPAPNLPISGSLYDASTGSATMVNNSFSVAAASGCGPLGLANGPINDALGLPSPAGKNTAVLTGTVNPIIGKGVSASVVASTTSGAAPLTVNFNGTGSTAAKPITSYAWDFGNGNTASGSTAFTTYTDPGTYTASLTVTDSDGDHDTTSTTITVAEPVNVPPTAAIGTSGTSGTAPFAVSLSGSGSSDPDGTITGYAWDLGNGQTATGPTASANYLSAGSYTVSLTVTDDRGATGVATQVITVAPKPNVPPTAVATTVSISGTIPLTVNLSGASSSDSDGTITNYAWDFGNGQTATGVTTQVVYPVEGTFTITLTVTDNQGAIGSQSVEINVSTNPNIAPTAQATATPSSGTAPLAVDFDGTGSSDVDGTIVAYSWNFGNGQSGSGATPSATYTVPGTYLVTLSVTDNRGATGTATTSVVVAEPANLPPTAQATATPASGTAPLVVSLSSAGSGDPDGTIASYAWTFGNGGTSTSPSPTAVYNTAGTYVVTLTVTDNKGATDAKSTTVQVAAANVPPTASIGVSSTTGSAPLDVSFNGANSSDPDGSIVSYAWTFGNGQTATGPTAQTTYTTTGSFTVKLTVTDNKGAARSTTTVIVVSGSNARPIPVLTALPTSGPAPLLVQLSAVGSTDPDGSIFAYLWEFGNGQTATGLRTQVNYTAPGTYIVKLTVVDNRGATGVTTETVVVDPALPIKDRVRLQFSGALRGSYDGPINTGNIRVQTDAYGVTTVSGTATYTGKFGTEATVSVNLSRFLWFNNYSGSVVVNDPDNGISNANTPLLLTGLSRPSSSSVRGSGSGYTNQVRAFSLTFTFDDRV